MDCHTCMLKRYKCLTDAQYGPDGKRIFYEPKPAVTFHGTYMSTHGYCEEHRCCKRCGMPVNARNGIICICKKGPLERPEYLEWKNRQKAVTCSNS